MLLRPPPPDLMLGASLFLDFDGTLVEIAEAPDAIRVGEGVRQLLADLSDRLGGRLVLVSGRSSADVRTWLAPLALPVVGSHGLELPGRSVSPPDELETGILQLQRLEQRFAGVLVERKPMGAALHYRQAPNAGEACRLAAEQVAAVTGLKVQPGKMVYELKPAEADKGTAIRILMAEPLHADTRPVFIGDDLTDEHGFAVARELGGAGVLVGEERPTAATYRLPGVAAVHQWLNDALERLP
ncbi:trehalose-phosphatase [Sphingomonas sp. LHG3406-1]|uniref:trehalose-phosphatase n=1 Tax=Sphingomonas sp. LHG3406-1 TaxID=2804617 RepID=UPI00262A9938|nr:trehalose-phosphatase [Sphingomonas sp. LHG3406-1]